MTQSLGEVERVAQNPVRRSVARRLVVGKRDVVLRVARHVDVVAAAVDVAPVPPIAPHTVDRTGKAVAGRSATPVVGVARDDKMRELASCRILIVYLYFQAICFFMARPWTRISYPL